MTPQCLDELAGFLAQFETGAFEGLAKDAAIKVFQVVTRHLAKTNPEKSN